MNSLPIATSWTKVPGPGFVGGPDGRILDINDWRVQVKARLDLSTIVELTRFEANDPGRFSEAQERVVAALYGKVFGDVRSRLLDLETQIRFELGPAANPEMMKKYGEIVQLVTP